MPAQLFSIERAFWAQKMSTSNIPQLLIKATVGSFSGGFNLRRLYHGPSEYGDTIGSYLNWGTVVVRIPDGSYVTKLEEDCTIVDNWDEHHYLITLFADRERVLECPPFG